MWSILTALLTAIVVTAVMYLDGLVCKYYRTKGYFVKLFVFTFLSCYGVCYIFNKNRLTVGSRPMFGGYHQPMETIHTGMPRF